MEISAKIGLKQTGKLALTQQLLQSIKLLQLSNLELAEKISAELLENPVLEEETAGLSSPYDEERELLTTVDKELSGDNSAILDKDEWNVSPEEIASTPYDSYDDERKRSFLENAVSQKETLKEHLIDQANLIAKNESELFLYEAIITSLDDNGFLAVKAEEIATSIELDVETVKEAISIVNSLDPVGCGAESIQESLVIQANHIYPDDEILLRILKEFFLDLEKLNYAKISSSLGIATSEVIRKSRLIHNLEPFPGIKYSSKKTRYILPDIDVRNIDNEIIITINDDWIPKIRISSYYKSILKKKTIDNKIADYLRGKIQSANNLLSSISNRRTTIIKVVSAVMEHQKDFLINGFGNLKPLVYADIAREVGLHESTISRVANNKFVQTPWGVFELKYFFVSKLKSRNESDHSSEKIMNLIKEIVSGEDPENPFSDFEILNQLQTKGINIARRTIAKYRTIMNISSSNLRKKINYIK